MVDSKAIFTASLLGLLLIVGGSTYLLQETGSKKSCSTGWQLNDNGSYSCGSRISYCSKVWNNANTQNYWCQEATLIKTDSKINGALQYLCSPEGCTRK